MNDITRIRVEDAVAIGRGDVLIVDDSRTTLQMIGRSLARLGYGTALCSSGSAALELLDSRRFDLVLLDLVMPGLSGMRTLREIRETAGTADLPVIMMTARSDRAAAIEALEAGADDHLAKPFEFPVLAARIESLRSRAASIAELHRRNAALDMRVAECAVEAGELRAELAAIHARHGQMARSLELMEQELARRQARECGATA